MKTLIFSLVLIFSIVLIAPAQQAWTLNTERGSKPDAKSTIVRTFYDGAQGTFKIETPYGEYDGPLDLPIITIDRHFYESSKCTPSVHAIGCPGWCSGIVDEKTKLTIVNRKIDRKELDLLNGRSVIVMGKVEERKDSEYSTHEYWSELTILVLE